MYKQTRAFDQNKAGTTKGYCLRNVRLGYSIPAKFDSAIIAWDNTEQHKDKSIPSGDVPLFYTYKVDGHINVRLKDGRIWNDGELYENLDAYISTHPSVGYLGWGESVNEVRVLEWIPDPVVSKMPPVGSSVKITVPRTAFVAGTTTVKGQLPPDVRIVRGYDPKYPNRILVNSASVGNGVAVALYYTNGVRIDGWAQL
jgi:hypothetical protein